MADKVYTSAEFKRERDNFTVSLVCLELPRLTPVKTGLKISYHNSLSPAIMSADGAADCCLQLSPSLM